MFVAQSYPTEPSKDLPTESNLGNQGRRAAGRNVSVYRPCKIVTSDGECLGLIRNFSEGGVQIETRSAIRPGEHILYCDAKSEPIPGTVVWAQGTRIGVKNDAEATFTPIRQHPRAVRVGCAIPCEIWIGGERVECVASNISQTGIFVSGVPSASLGSAATVTLAGRTIYNSHIRWKHGDGAGIKFPEAVAMQTVIDILERAQQ